MNIVYLSGTAFSDTDFPLIKQFQELGHDVHFFLKLSERSLCNTIIEINKIRPVNRIIPASDYPELQRFEQYMDISQMYVVNRKYVKEKHPLSQFLSLRLAYKIYKINPDIIIAIEPFSFDYLSLYLFRKKIVFVVHDPFPHSGEESFHRSLLRSICFKLGKRFILLNKQQVKKFMQVYKLHENSIMVNSISTIDVMKTLAKNEDRQQIDIVNILCFGRISPYKGIEYLCEAMDIIHKKHPNVKLTIAGSGKIYFDKEKYINRDYIRMINRFIKTDELADFIYECDFVCCPYTDATQSGVVMSSFAFNKPVVATNVGGISEQVEDGVTGYLALPKNAQDLARVIEKMIDNKSIITTISQNIENMYHNNNSMKSWRHIANKYIEYFNKK